MLVRGKLSFKKRVAISLLFGLCFTAVIEKVSAESLFRAGISYQTVQAYTPRSLFVFPRPSGIGDMVIVNINENTAINVQNTSTLTKKRTLSENGTQVANNIVKKITGISQLFPSVDGLKNDDETTMTAQAQKAYTFTDSITCQVVQVLPNGDLMVQGKKTLNANQEAQDLYVSGIVNPKYLDINNAIDSSKIANLQMNVSQNGMVSRQQGDGVIGKYFGLFN